MKNKIVKPPHPLTPTRHLVHVVLWRVALAHILIVALWAWGLNAAGIVVALTCITSVLSYMMGTRAPRTTPPPRMFRA